MKIIKFFAFIFILSACKKDSTSPSGVGPNSFLSGQQYDKLVVEIQYVNGYQPTAATIANLNSFLQSLLNKPAGIEIKQNSIASPGKAAYSLDDIKNIEK